MLEHAGETGASSRGFQPGRPRSFPAGSTGLNAPGRPDNTSRAALNLSEAATSSSAQLGKTQPEVVNPGSTGELLPYACEDCGLRFKDAPSRNRHQTLMHYSSEGREEEEEGPRKELSSGDTTPEQRV